MDWEEIIKAIFAHIATWTATDIVFPGQDVPATTTTWLEIHVLDTNHSDHRAGDKKRGEILLQIGIFTTQRNVYSLESAFYNLSILLSQADIKSANYMLRCRTPDAQNIPWQGGKNLEKTVYHKAVTLAAKIWEL